MHLGVRVRVRARARARVEVRVRLILTLMHLPETYDNVERRRQQCPPRVHWRLAACG